MAKRQGTPTHATCSTTISANGNTNPNANHKSKLCGTSSRDSTSNGTGRNDRNDNSSLAYNANCDSCPPYNPTPNCTSVYTFEYKSGYKSKFKTNNSHVYNSASTTHRSHTCAHDCDANTSDSADLHYIYMHTMHDSDDSYLFGIKGVANATKNHRQHREYIVDADTGADDGANANVNTDPHADARSNAYTDNNTKTVQSTLQSPKSIRTL